MYTCASHSAPGSPRRITLEVLSHILMSYYSNIWIHFLTDFNKHILPFWWAVGKQQPPALKPCKQIKNKKRLMSPGFCVRWAEARTRLAGKKLSPASTGALQRQLRKQHKLQISRLWSQSMLILGCSKIRPVLQSLLQLCSGRTGSAWHDDYSHKKGMERQPQAPAHAVASPQAEALAICEA